MGRPGNNQSDCVLPWDKVQLTTLSLPMWLLWLSACVFVCLTEGHPATDDLRALLHIWDGGYRKTPVCYRTPEMLHVHSDISCLVSLHLSQDGCTTETTWLCDKYNKKHDSEDLKMTLRLLIWHWLHCTAQSKQTWRRKDQQAVTNEDRQIHRHKELVLTVLFNVFQGRYGGEKNKNIDETLTRARTHWSDLSSPHIMNKHIQSTDSCQKKPQRSYKPSWSVWPHCIFKMLKKRFSRLIYRHILVSMCQT